MKVQKLQLKRTISIQSIIDSETTASYCDEDQDPKQAIVCFKSWWIDEVRDACLKVISKHGFSELQYFDWAREAIESLIEVGDDRMAGQIMDLYSDTLFRKGEDCNRSHTRYYFYDAGKQMESYGGDYGEKNLWTEFLQMLLFCIRMADKPSFRRPILKFVCLCVDPDIFQGIYYHNDNDLQTGLKLLFATTLNEIKAGYGESEWHSAERVLRIIAKAKDRTYIDQLKNILAAHESGKACPEFRIGHEVARDFFRAGNVAVIKETLRILRESPKKAKQPA